VSNEAVKAICDHMGSRDRNQAETKMRRIMRHLTNDGFDLRRSELIAAFRELEGAGCGKYIEGRHGWPSRFVWDVKSTSVAPAAKGTEHLEPAAQEDALEVESEETDLIEHSFALRPDLAITIELPADFSKNEAGRLAAFVQSLPFGEEG
jgi:hypothetical protein